MRYMVVVEQGAQGFGAYVPDLLGCVAAGESKGGVLALIREAIELHLEAMEGEGLAIPPPSSSGEYVEVGVA